MIKDPYKVLGLSEDASPEELEKRRARINAAALNCIMSWGKDEKKDEQNSHDRAAG